MEEVEVWDVSGSVNGMEEVREGSAITRMESPLSGRSGEEGESEILGPFRDEGTSEMTVDGLWVEES